MVQSFSNSRATCERDPFHRRFPSSPRNPVRDEIETSDRGGGSLNEEDGVNRDNDGEMMTMGPKL